MTHTFAEPVAALEPDDADDDVPLRQRRQHKSRAPTASDALGEATGTRALGVAVVHATGHATTTGGVRWQRSGSGRQLADGADGYSGFAHDRTGRLAQEGSREEAADLSDGDFEDVPLSRRLIKASTKGRGCRPAASTHATAPHLPAHGPGQPPPPPTRPVGSHSNPFDHLEFGGEGACAERRVDGAVSVRPVPVPVPVERTTVDNILLDFACPV